MEARIVLATDLDRTLLPNGTAPESSDARPRFRRFAARPQVTLVYVTGRHRELVEQAESAYDLPVPDFVIGDVGTSVYAIRDGDWHPSQDWTQAIMADWAGRNQADLAAVLSAIPDLRLQEASKQGVCKLSYYAPPLADPSPLREQVRAALASTGAKCNLVWSIDETTDTGLLDVLPASASKLHALEFLREQLAIPLEHTVFAGDSGNDMEVFASAIPSVLVGNARETVRAEAVAAARRSGNEAALYLARGGLANMNGNYSAGILEGLAHFIPATRSWLEVE
ncbi:MAG: HAD-IIB family hydrolase [Thiobacillaceae bacterium]